MTHHPDPPALGGPTPTKLHPIATEPADDEVPELRRRAAAMTDGDESLRDVSVEGIDHVYVCRRPTRAEFDTYWNDAQVKETGMQASRNLARLCVLWPNRTRLRLEEETFPALTVRLCDALETWAGFDKPAEVELKAGAEDLTANEVDLLKRYHHPGQLRRVSFRVTPTDWDTAEQEVIDLVVKRPEAGVYESFIRGYNSGTNKAGASYDAALSSIVQPVSTEEKRALLDKYPGIHCKLGDVMVLMGGAGKRVTAKKR